MSYRNISEKILIFGVYFLLLTPFLFQQSLLHPLITLKTVIFQVVVEVLAAIYFFLIIFYPEYRPKFNNLKLSLLVLMGVLLLSSFFGVNLHRSFWSTPERMTGIFLWLHLTTIFFMLTSLGSRIKWVNFFSFSTIVSFLVAVFPIIALAFPKIFFDSVTGRLSSTLGNAIFLSIYLFFHVGFGLWLARHFYQSKKNLPAFFFGIITVFNFGIMLWTQTRSIFVSLFASVVFLALGYIYRTYKINKTYLSYKIYAAIALVVLLVLFLTVFFLTREAGFWQNIPGLVRFTQLNTAVPRLFAWKAGLKSFLEAPILGWGWENFYFAFNKNYDPHLFQFGFGESYFDKPHNVYLEFLVTTGLLGFLAYGWLLTEAFRKANFWLKGLLVGYFVHNFFAFDTLSSYLMFFAALAFIDSPATKLQATKLQNGYENYESCKNKKLIILILLFGLAGLPIYFVNFRAWRANHWEYFTINYFVQDKFAEGLPFWQAALEAPNVYSNYIRKDLASAIPELYKKNKPLPDTKNLISLSMGILNQVIANDPLHYFSYLRFADAAIEVFSLDFSYLDEAEKKLKEAEKISPNRQATLYVLSKIYNLKGNKEASLAAMKKAASLAPEVGEPHFYYGLLLLDFGDTKEGLEELKIAKELGREAHDADEARVAGGYFADANDYENAIYYFRKALELNDKDDEARLKLGITYYLAGKKDLAKKFIGEVVKTHDLTQSPQYESLKPILNELGLEK